MSRALSIYQLKPRFQDCLRPIMRALVRAGVRPNAVTMAALVGSVAVAAVIAVRPASALALAIVPAWLLARMALNALDGMMARNMRRESARGFVLNELGDVVADIAIFLAFALAVPAAAWPLVWFTLAAVVSEFCGVLGVVVTGNRRYEGPMGKSDRACLVGLVCLLTMRWPALAIAWPAVFWAGTGMAVVTCARRLTQVRHD